MTPKLRESLHTSTDRGKVPRRAIPDMTFLSLVAIAVGVTIALLIANFVLSRVQ
jgi:hypothetical protein